ncbi:MAG: Hsp70 family protein [Lachnospiraceae bacterium]|nr:Hsp70 family protein [Lachnospiraceae bacterium]
MILGIDLGTSNSMAAIYKEGQPVLIQSRTGNSIIPSVVGIDENGCFCTGEMAKMRKYSYPEDTVAMFKSSMGTEKVFQIKDKKLKAEELSAILLKGIKEDAEAFLGEEITDVIICVPAFFNNPQRKAVLRAGELAGLKVRRLVNEPTAAAIAYGIQDFKPDENIEEEQKVIIVLDLGGGTFDISVMEMTDHVMEVIAVCGDNHLGGGDFTKRLIDLFLKENSIKEKTTAEEETNLWNQAEKAKCQITKEGRGEIRCVLNQVEYVYHITEAEYEKACMDLLEKIRKLTLKAVKESKYEPEEV